MSKPLVQMNNIVSFVVLLLMIVAVVAGQAGKALSDSRATAATHQSALLAAHVVSSVEDELRATLLKISIDVADARHFRGEDE